MFLLKTFPGKMEEMGLGVDVLQSLNPRLVIARVSGWGQTGPYAHKPGFGTLVEAMSGFAHLNGFPDREPALPPLAMADMYAGIYGAFGVLAALRNVEHGDGKGQVVDVALFESLYSTLASEAVKYQQPVLPTVGWATRPSIPHQETSMHVQTENFWLYPHRCSRCLKTLLQAIGRPELIEDRRFLTNEDRVIHCQELNKILSDYFGTIFT